MSTTNIERILIELAQTETRIKNIAGITFTLLTITENHVEDFDGMNNDEIIEHASTLGLAIKGERACDFKGMTKEKLDVFWSRPEFAVNDSEESIRTQFGLAVLEESNMLDLLQDESEEEQMDISDIDVDLNGLEQDAESYNPA